MKCLSVFLSLMCVFALSSCTDIRQTTLSETTPIPTPTFEELSPTNIQGENTVNLTVLMDLLLKAANDFKTYFNGQNTQNVIGFFKDESECEIPILEFNNTNSSFNEACNYFDYYSPEMLLLELRRHGFEVVDDSIGLIASGGENRYYIEDGTSTRRLSTFNLVYQDESKVVLSVDCYSDTDNGPEQYEYTFDITDKDHPIIVDISGYGLQPMIDRKVSREPYP